MYTRPHAAIDISPYSSSTLANKTYSAATLMTTYDSTHNSAAAAASSSQSAAVAATPAPDKAICVRPIHMYDQANGEGTEDIPEDDRKGNNNLIIIINLLFIFFFVNRSVFFVSLHWQPAQMIP